MIRKAQRHPQLIVIHGTTSGATSAPTLVPELNTPVASARSRFGNHSATALIDAGKLPASPRPSPKRARLNPATAPPSITNVKPVFASSASDGMSGPL